ncbi:MAG: four helix bundle protein [Bacteroidota bacterium]|nr:four helix bundle protein [Bacteroidota bacterium]
MGDYKDLLAYKKAYELAMEIFQVTKDFPEVEKYGLTDQIRRSSRSVCTNIGEAYRKRRYPAHFISKLTDAESENTETEIWLHFAKDCCYISAEKYEQLFLQNAEVGKLIWYMINNPNKFL